MLGTNLTYEDNNTEKIKWRVNLKAIKNGYYDIIGYENYGIYEGNILVLQGEKSHRWDIGVFKNNFPKITNEDIKIVEKAGMMIILYIKI